MRRREFIAGITAGVSFAKIPNLLLSAASSDASGEKSQDPPDSLYSGFQNPPREYDIFPLWTWNGKIEVPEAERQIDEMLGQGIKRAIVYPFPNLRIRFLSEDWWRIWGHVLAYARSKGFQLGVNIENTFPDGNVHDQWLNPPYQSLVLQGYPEYRMKRLAYVERGFVGPGPVRFNGLPHPIIAVAARIKGPGLIDGESLVDLSRMISGPNFSGELPAGSWLLMFFFLEGTSAQGMWVDPLNPDAIARFIDLTLGEYYRRFKEYFGKTFTFVLDDNEGDYGKPIAWTPALFDTFRAEKGYDLRKYLPLLVYEAGPRTPKIRIDYLRVISKLFQTNYWGQISKWCERHGLQFTGQGWSESLEYDAAFDGDYMAMNRALTMPGVEAISNRGRSPREFIEDRSIADFEGRRYWTEGPLVLGSRTYVSPEKERYATNMLGLWGINLFSPQFYYDAPGMEWPPEVFTSQPWWKYFRHYTDYLRRISYMNGEGRQVADLLLYRPTDTTFAYSGPIFAPARVGPAIANEAAAFDTGSWQPTFRPDSAATVPTATSMVRDSGYETTRHGPALLDYYPAIVWNGNFAFKLEVCYYDLMEVLTGYQRAFDVVDDYYLERMQRENGTLNIRGMSFRGIILPPMKIISREALSRIRQFYDDGGLVVAYGDLPSGSSEEGWNDPVIAADVKAIFGVEPTWSKDAENHNAQGGNAYFVVGNLRNILKPLDNNLEADFQVVDGPRERLLYLHRIKEGRDLYWIVNDKDRARNVVVSLAAHGKPELWDPTTGKRRETAYWVQEKRTIVPLHFDPWDATYVVLNHLEDTVPDMNITSTNLESYTLKQLPSGEVEFEGHVPSNVRRAYVAGEKGGKKFQVEAANQSRTEPQVLSSGNWRFKPEAEKVEVRYARENVVPAGDGVEAGFELPTYNDRIWNVKMLSPAEDTIRRWLVIGPFPNPDDGEGYNTVYPPEEKIDIDATYADAYGVAKGWRYYESTTPEINLGKALGAPLTNSVAGYAATWVYSPRQQQVQIIVVGDTKLWINHRQVYGRYWNPPALRDAFGHVRTVELKEGWNQVLVKATKSLFFYLRFMDSQGLPVEGLFADWTPSAAEVVRKAEAAKERDASLERWYRVEVPAGTRAFLLPKSPSIQAVFLNGREVKPADGRVEYPRLDFQENVILALKLRGGDELMTPLAFGSGETNYHLGSWTRTGLTYYVGSAVYEKTFRLAPELEGKQVMLDCGRVGLTAEIWINGKKVGERIWEPFSLNVTGFLQPGENQLKVVVTNSDASLRAIPDFKRYLEIEDGSFEQQPPYMDVIDMNGLMGPVRLLSYWKVHLTTDIQKSTDAARTSEPKTHA